MKKILTILAVALLACTTVFAAVNFSGSSTIGYQINYDNDQWQQLFYGDDGDDTNPNSLNLSISDDNGIWSVGFRAGLNATRGVNSNEDPSKEGDETVNDNAGATLSDSGSMGGNVTIDFAKLIGLEDWTLNAGMIGNDRYTTLRAYSNQSGNNFDRIRTAANSYVAWLGVGYGGYVQAQVAVDPGLNGGNDDNIVTTSDILASALVTPLSGLEVSVDYAWKGEADGKFGAAVDANIGTLAGLDFDLGVSAAYVMDINAEEHQVAATVYGGVDVVDLAVEYAYTFDAAHYLYVGANLNVVENMLLDVYFGANDVTDFANEFFVGGDIGYTISGMTFKLGVEYAAADSYNYDLSGLNIVPSVSFSW